MTGDASQSDSGWRARERAERDGDQPIDKSVPEFWTGRYESGDAHWELGVPSPALEQELRLGLLTEVGATRGDRVLVPGCGRGFDLLPFARRGLVVTGVDFAAPAVVGARELLQSRGLDAEVVQADVFELGSEHDGRYALVFDHTCVCALPKARHREYADRVARWLRPGGHLVHVAFPADPARDPDEGPPFRMLRDDCEAIFGGVLENVASRTPMTSHVKRWRRERIDVWRRTAGC